MADKLIVFIIGVFAWFWSFVFIAISVLTLLGLISIHTECQCDQKAGYTLKRFIHEAYTECKYTQKNDTNISFIWMYSPDYSCSSIYPYNNKYCFEKKGPIDDECKMKRIIIVLPIFFVCLCCSIVINISLFLHLANLWVLFSTIEFIEDAVGEDKGLDNICWLLICMIPFNICCAPVLWLCLCAPKKNRQYCFDAQKY